VSNLGAIQTPPQWMPQTSERPRLPEDGEPRLAPSDSVCSTLAVGQGEAFALEQASMSNLRRYAMMGGVLLAGLGAGPSGATTRVPLELAAPDTPSIVIAPDTTALSQSFGLTSRGTERVAQDAALQAKARLVPDQAAAMFRSYSPNQKRYLYQTFTQETRVGLVTVNNREAFVNGRAYGRDVFPYMSDNLHKAVDTGELSRDEMLQLDSDLSVMKQLTPTERDAIASLVVADQAS
jgi:hypothetical protein